MAQAGFTPIQLYFSTTAAAVPTAANLAQGELAINITDGKLYYENNSGVVTLLASATTVTNSFSAGTTGFTPSTATTGAVTLGGTLITSNGGTGLASYTAGDLSYYASGTALTKLAIGTAGQILTSTGTAPQWSTLSGVAVTTFSAGTTGFTPSTATSGAVTLAGTLATTNGGTGLTSFTANGVVYASSTSALATGSALTFDGTNLTVGTGASTYKLNVYGASSPYLGVSDGTINTFFGAATGGSIAALGTTSNHPVSFYSNSAEQMRLTSTGLGIGTSSPATRLSVDNTRSDTAGTGWFTYTNAAVTSGKRGMRVDANNGYWFDYYDGSTWSAQMGLDSSGNLGLGVTPSAWETGDKAFQVLNGGVWGRGNSLRLTGNVYWNGTNHKYLATDTAAIFAINYLSSGFAWFTAPSGTAGTNATLTQAMTLDASGNLGIGTSSPSDILTLAGGASGSYGLTINNAKVGGGTKAIFQYDATNAIALVGGNTTNGLAFQTLTGGSLTTKATIDSSGNLGLGVTPSAWGTGFQSIIEVNNIGALAAAGPYISVLANAYYNSSSQYIYKTTQPATHYAQAVGAHQWFTAPSGTAGNAITFTQAMTLDASGNLMVGGTSQLYGASGRGLIQVSGSTDALIGFGTTGNTGLGFLYHTGTNFQVTNAQNGYLSFGTNNTERARIDSSGNLMVGTTTAGTKFHAVGGNLWSSNFYEVGRFQKTSGTGVSLGYDNTSYVATIGAYSHDGTASNLSFWTYPGSGAVVERARIDSSGRLLVGTTVAGSGGIGVTVYSPAQSEIRLQNSTTGTGDGAGFQMAIDSTSGYLWNINSGIIFGGNSVERMRIDSSGNLLVGTTSQLYGAAGSRLNVDSGGSGTATFKTSGGSAQSTLYSFNSATTGDNAFISFGTEATWTERGSITYNRTGGLVVYNTTSDYRAKDISGPVTNSGALIDSVPVYMGKMKWATQERPMFIAHETPDYAHTGEKDAVDADGNPVYQQMDASALIPVMWAEIQSLRKRLADAGI